MTKWIVVGVVVLAAACLTGQVSAQVSAPPPQEMAVMPANTMVVMPATTSGGLFARLRARRGLTTVYYQPGSAVPMVTTTGSVVTAPPIDFSGSYSVVTRSGQLVTGAPAVVQAGGIGIAMPVGGIQQVQSVSPGAMTPMPMGTAVVQTPMTYEVRRGLLGRVRVRTVRY